MMVSVNAADPAATEVGLRPVIVGLVEVMVKVEADELPFVVVTTTLAVPAFLFYTSAAGADRYWVVP